MADDVAPKNILMIGPTGVGKTEIARRLARLAQSPFLKVEASRFTEVGYVGRDVESMIRDLVEIAVGMVREEREREVRQTAETSGRGAAARPAAAAAAPHVPPGDDAAATRRGAEPDARAAAGAAARAAGSTSAMVELEVREQGDAAHADRRRHVDRGDRPQPARHAAGHVPGARGDGARMKVPEARAHLIEEEQQKLVDMESVARTAIERVEQGGIIFVDEIDKIAGREGGHGPDVSREGVQRDILPIVEGTTVNTKHGMVRTDHILFIAAGAFHVSKPSDLIPELQGRFPIRVELDALGRDEFVRILPEPQNALLKQYTALMATEGIDARGSPTTPSSGSPSWRRWSTSGPRTSARGGCTR